jgi:hypothetical protein
MAPGGHLLAADSGLSVQGIEDGGVLIVAAGADDRPPRVYDDAVEAMADVVERELAPWNAAAARRTALWTAVLLLAVGAGSVLPQPGSGVAGALAATAAGVLVLGAVALSRMLADTGAAVTVAVMGWAYAAVSGLVLGGDSPLSAPAVAAAGGAALVAGMLSALGLAEGRVLLLPPILVGAVVLVTGVAMRVPTLDPAVVLTSTMAAAVLGGGALPSLALAVTVTHVDQATAVDQRDIAADVRLAHQILVALSATVGLLLVLVAPFAVSLDLAGTTVAVLACLVLMLRVRHHHSATAVLVGLLSGVLGLVSIAVSVLLLHPEWRLPAAVVLVVASVLLLAVTFVPHRGSIRRARLGDLLECAAVVSMVPALVVATGVLAAVRG